MTREIWDLEENDGFETYYINSIPYKVLLRNSNVYVRSQKANILSVINSHVDALCEHLYYKKSVMNKDLLGCFLPGINIFLNTPHRFMEIDSCIFNGLNKPKDIYYKENCLPVGKDGKHRASYRIVMLNLDDLSYLPTLVIHELAHTFCNHVFFRRDDHGSDFKKYESFVKYSMDTATGFSETFVNFLESFLA